jgi:putative peptidoglycan lipid II flippase
MRDLFEKSLKTLLFLILPGTVFLITCRYPVIALLFEHGAFTAADTARTALPLLFYSCNLPFALVNFFLLGVLWATQDHGLVLKLSLLALVVNVLADIVLMSLIGYSGIALANLPRGMIIFVIMTFIFRKKIADVNLKGLTRAAAGFLCAGLGALGASGALMHLLGNGERRLDWILRIAICAAATSIVYFVLCRVTAPREFAAAVEFVRRKISGNRSEASKDKAPWNGSGVS